jgi:hypothetical protein
MGVNYDASRDKYVVRWKADGRRRVRRFEGEFEAIALAESVARPAGKTASPFEHILDDAAARRVEARLTNRRDGIYSNETRQGRGRGSCSANRTERCRAVAGSRVARRLLTRNDSCSRASAAARFACPARRSRCSGIACCARSERS